MFAPSIFHHFSNSVLFGSVKELSKYRQKFGNMVAMVVFSQLFVSVLEGFGIALAIPLLQSMLTVSGGHEVPASNFVGDLVELIFSFFSISVTFLSLTCFFCLIFLFKGLAYYHIQRFIISSKVKMIEAIRSDLLFDCFNSDFETLINSDHGKIANLVMDQSQRAGHAFICLSYVFALLFNFLIYFSFGVLAGGEFTLYICVFGFLMFAGFGWVNLRVKEYSREFVESSKSLSSNLVSFCRAMLYLRATGQDAECSKITDSHSEAVSNAQYRMGVASTITQAIREPLVVFGIGLSLYLSLDQFANEIPVFLVSLVLLHRSLNSLLAIQGAWQNSLEFSASFDEYLDQQGSVAARRPRQHARPATDDFDGLDFKQVCLRNESIKSGEAKTFSVQIPRGAFVAVVGHSGSGKTTFLYATVGLIEPHQGGISVFGQDPFQWSTEFRREKLGLVTQDVFVAKGTLVGNVLAPYKPGVEFRQDQVKKVSDLIKELGFSDLAFGDEGDKLVLDGGLNLSGGQRQRLCFLREILKVPELLILDEVTSGLDRSNRDNVTIYLQRYTKHNQGVPKTVILTTHHRDVADRADLILLMENGQVVEIGHPSVLASNVQSKYNLLFNACSQEGLDR